MDKICEDKNCTGCMACFNACPTQAIQMQIDNEGFQRPEINNSICINCNKCEKVCPTLHPVNKELPLKIYSGWSNNSSIRLQSSSGGAFSEIAIPILRKGGVIFGAMFNSNWEVIHSYIEKEEELYKLRGSKYVQSYIGASFRNAKLFLTEGRPVLFVGTPCQIAGLKNYLNKNYNNLYTIDLVCHGVPSPQIFESYKVYIKSTEQIASIEEIAFRNKKFSWIYYNMYIKGYIGKANKRKEYIGTYYKDPYIRGFLREYFIRPNCHTCNFTTTERVSDFTIADWWGYKACNKKDKGFSEKGVSLIFCNSQKAVNLIPYINMNLDEKEITDAIQTNLSLRKPFAANANRSSFWEDYRKYPFSQIVAQYMAPQSIPLYLNISSTSEHRGLNKIAITASKLSYRIYQKVLGAIKQRKSTC